MLENSQKQLESGPPNNVALWITRLAHASRAVKDGLRGTEIELFALTAFSFNFVPSSRSSRDLDCLNDQMNRLLELFDFDHDGTINEVEVEMLMESVVRG